MLHLYGIRGGSKIWAKIISTYAKKCSGCRSSSLRGGESPGAKIESGHLGTSGMNDDGMAYN